MPLPVTLIEERCYLWFQLQKGVQSKTCSVFMKLNSKERYLALPVTELGRMSKEEGVCMRVCVCVCVCTKSLQLCLGLCEPMDCSPPGISVHGIPHTEYWSRLPCPPLGDLPNPGTESAPPVSSAFARRFFTTSTTCEAPAMCIRVADSLCCT